MVDSMTLEDCALAANGYVVVIPQVWGANIARGGADGACQVAEESAAAAAAPAGEVIRAARTRSAPSLRAAQAAAETESTASIMAQLSHIVSVAVSAVAAVRRTVERTNKKDTSLFADMGFSELRVAKAMLLNLCGRRAWYRCSTCDGSPSLRLNAQLALDWLVNHAEDPGETDADLQRPCAHRGRQTSTIPFPPRSSCSWHASMALVLQCSAAAADLGALTRAVGRQGKHSARDRASERARLASDSPRSAPDASAGSPSLLVFAPTASRAAAMRRSSMCTASRAISPTARCVVCDRQRCKGCARGSLTSSRAAASPARARATRGIKCRSPSTVTGVATRRAFVLRHRGVQLFLRLRLRRLACPVPRSGCQEESVSLGPKRVAESAPERRGVP
jgi:hypothetical protein